MHISLHSAIVLYIKRQIEFNFLLTDSSYLLLGICLRHAAPHLPVILSIYVYILYIIWGIRRFSLRCILWKGSLTVLVTCFHLSTENLSADYVHIISGACCCCCR